jgi:hypothetical protein
MDNHKSIRTEPFTLRDELAFVDGGSVEVDRIVMRDEDDGIREEFGCHEYLNDDGVEMEFIAQVLEHGLIAAGKMHQKAEILALQQPSRESMFRRYFLGVCAGMDRLKTFLIIPSAEPGFPESPDFRASLSSANGNRQPICEKVAVQASEMAERAYLHMNSLNSEHVSGRVYRDVGFVASLLLKSPTGRVFNCRVKARFDYVEVFEGEKVFLGAYEMAPCCAESSVRRLSREKHWALRAYLGRIMAAAYFGLPAEWTYVVSSTEHDICRAYDVGTTSLEEARVSLLRGIFRLCSQSTPDEVYLRSATL